MKQCGYCFSLIDNSMNFCDSNCETLYKEATEPLPANQGAEKKHEVAIQAAKKIGILSGPPLACFCDGYDAAFKEGDQEKFILALKKDIADLYEEQFKDRQEIERLKEEINRMTRLYNELNHLTSGY